jgi:cell division protein FtsI/penicillin-binding protein 2
MPRKPKTHIKAALDYQKSEDKKAREEKRKGKRAVQATLPHTARAKRPKKTKWVQLTIDHAIQRFNEEQRHAELSAYESQATAQHDHDDASGQAQSGCESCSVASDHREAQGEVTAA